MKLRRYWFKFSLTLADPHPSGTLLGCGVTAYSQEDAVALIAEKVFPKMRLRLSKTCKRMWMYRPWIQDMYAPIWEMS